ncbi:NAD(+) diphosphatase [Methylobacterium persicinum]|uniref:NAD(+) diphosphatase n=1 Tax=Methylobacterium persicinum TaxID=374426 RepID=A0ABU0HLP3_9HYPH|nr:NAD(+) diphosphatase [Methylobacterium persicinum]MDQ0443237.1 NAD+ diphosphatase [Methylobacterium persicinum]GJE38187.1 NADH pyrophosphatase [Methylobacterium persicinum]
MTDPLSTLGFARNRLDRHSAEQPEEAVPPIDGDGTRLLLLGGDRFLLRNGTALLDAASALTLATGRIETVFLGRWDGRPAFAASVPADEMPTLEGGDMRSLDLRSIATEAAVEAEELGLLAVAKSMLDWHGRYRFCANCGAPTFTAAGGFRRECKACNAHHFPRVDPVVIMLVRRGERCLLGRGPHFRPHMFSCLAGFLEPGETLEDAVRREVFEETKIRVGAVSYRASQPWPFPSSLMLGCTAEALNEDIVTDPAELEDARWFDRDSVRAMLDSTHPEGILSPPPMAIAHILMRQFVEE